MKTKKISHIIMMGDSLSDRGTLNNRYLLGFIPMRWLSGLANKSPIGRFTNGFAWSDNLSAKIISQFIIEDFRKNNALEQAHVNTPHCTEISDALITGNRRVKKKTYKWDVTDTADAVLAHDRKITKSIHDTYNLDNDLLVQYEGLDFIRNYVEGGLTAHDYSWMPSKSISRFFSRLILSSLSGMREQLLDYDKNHAISMKNKAKTLVVEWSGANDLITVNEEPSKQEVDDAIRARISNATQLIKNGYRHFVLFNLPDLALTPRYQNKSQKSCETASQYSKYFNQQLTLKCQKLQKYYPYCSIQVCDTNALFTDLYQQPEKNGFEKAKLKTPYAGSKDFLINPNGTSPSKGYMFFDDVHPTADVHAKLSALIYETSKKSYTFVKPTIEAINDQEELHVDEADMLLCFRHKYGKTFNKNKNGFFGSFYQSNINYKTASLEDILRHALHEGGNRTRKIITDLDWIDKSGNVYLNIPVLKNAMQRITAGLSTSN